MSVTDTWDTEKMLSCKPQWDCAKRRALALRLSRLQHKPPFLLNPGPQVCAVNPALSTAVLV